MKLSYWGFIKEKEFNKWLDSFDIDYTHSYCIINQINSEREYELLVSEWDLVIKWNVSYKEYHDELGGCITRIYLSTWENGFSYRFKFIELKLDSKKLRKELIINTDIFYITLYITEKQNILNFLNDYMLRINPELSKKFIRDKKIKDILN